jgi:hypothetical protein
MTNGSNHLHTQIHKKKKIRSLTIEKEREDAEKKKKRNELAI